ncbi:CBO0543 family protein [Brevibacillus fluminis]|uniref:CBO0543 family protein n=1 Tax=Brevibacillus fluminis TaxID=511487 RepID=UPI003F8906EB
MFILNLRNDFYGYFNVGADYRTLIIFFGLYPAFSLIFLNLYPHSAGFLRKTSYIIVFSVLSTALEWLFSTKYGFFYHNEWKLLYSLLAYPFILLLLLFHLVMIRKLFASNRF